ncbi:MAG: glycosyl transferase, family 2 [Clostridia bacterium]|jgi:cellulose synthase/poly-beta-1,6-N-acetylglucosamine synthase-like glycosyltransferase|nr:glycosyl transferase, family 2 [Clostridia bacterium]
MSSISLVIIIFQVLYFFYFIGISLHYLILNISAAFVIAHHMEEKPSFNRIKTYSGFELPVSIIVPAYNEEKTIISTVFSLLMLKYPEYEIIIVNDGSSDNTLQSLIERFSLIPYPEAYKRSLDVNPIHTFYRSTTHPNIRVIDKQNGGKSDALNAGINLSKFPLFCCIDADSLLSRDSMLHVVSQFLDDTRTIACGGTIRIANGCKFKEGQLLQVGLSTNILALIQTMEYLRAFLFGRLGWVPVNSLLIVSGSFSLFKKQPVINVGGYSTGTIGEDMELVVRLHRYYRTHGIPYKITAIPEPICFTEAPEDLHSLKNQRVRWQRGLAESLWKNIDLLLHPKSGFLGWVAYPLTILFELVGPLIELAGYVFFLAGYFLGIISPQALVAFLILAIGFSLFISIVTIALEEMSFHIYPKLQNILLLFFAALLENCGFRQINTVWRVAGTMKWLFRFKGSWGAIERKGTSSTI